MNRRREKRGELMIMKRRVIDTAAKTAMLFSLFFIAAGSVFAQSTGSTKDIATNAAPNTNTQTVNAQQAGSWNVGIDPARNTVQLANSEANPLPVKIVQNGPTRKPFQRRVIVTIPASYGVGSTSLPIPAGKRMIIENVSAVARYPEGLDPFMLFLVYFDDGNGVLDAPDIAYHRIALVEQSLLNGVMTSTANHKVLVFADAQYGNASNLAVTVSFGVTGYVSQATTAELTITGYLEDLPTAQ